MLRLYGVAVNRRYEAQDAENQDAFGAFPLTTRLHHFARALCRGNSSTPRTDTTRTVCRHIGQIACRCRLRVV